MRSRAVLAIAALSACGRLHFAERAAPDAYDAPIDALGTCDATAPFGAPVPIAELDDPASNDGTLRLFPDELSGYFWSFRGSANAALYLATRPDLASPFTITPVQGLGLAGNLLDPTFTSDGSLLVFRHSLPGDDLYEATRVSPDTFTAGTAIANLDTGSMEVQPFMPGAGDLLVFSSSRSGGGDLYVSTRSGTTFSTPAQVTELSTANEEGDPVLTDDGLTCTSAPIGRAGPRASTSTSPRARRPPTCSAPRTSSRTSAPMQTMVRAGSPRTAVGYTSPPTVPARTTSSSPRVAADLCAQATWATPPRSLRGRHGA